MDAGYVGKCRREHYLDGISLKRKLNRGRFAAGSAAALASIGIIPSKARAADFTLKFSTTEPVETPINVRGRQAFDRIRKETNGRVDIQLFPSNILGGLTAVVSQMRAGAVAFVPTDPLALSNIVPAAGIAGVGFAWKDVAQGFVAMDGEFGDYLRKEIRAKGIYVFDRMFDIGMRNVTSYPRAIVSPDDMVNFKIRTPPGKLSLELFRAFGASPVPLNFSEVYTGLQTHIIDGQENPLFLIEAGHLFEVQRYLSLTSHQWWGYFVLANQDVWSGIPRDLQAIITKHFNQYISEQRRDNALLNATLLDKLKRRGMIVNKTEQGPFRAKLGNFYKNAKAEFGGTAWALLEKYSGKLG